LNGEGAVVVFGEVGDDGGGDFETGVGVEQLEDVVGGSACAKGTGQGFALGRFGGEAGWVCL
jgi:hypothetical protein